VIKAVVSPPIKKVTRSIHHEKYKITACFVFLLGHSPRCARTLRGARPRARARTPVANRVTRGARGKATRQ